MHDYAHRFTDKEIAALEKEVAAVYKQATAEAEEKLNDYFKRFATKDKIWAAKVANGERTAAEYAQWRQGQLIVGARWKAMSDKLAEEYHKANVIARDIALGHRAAVYAENFNFATYGIEKAAKVNTSFTVYSRESVERIVRDQPELLPPPGKRMKKALKQNPDIAWQKGQIQSVTMQSILQGESIPNMAKRIAQTMGEQNHGSTIRYARTAMTGAQNAGRIDAYHRAESLSIDIEQQWIATLDGRTRFEHRQLDGRTAKVGEPFKVDGYEIMFPGDPTADAEMIWNCRCTTIAVVNGISHDLSRRAMDESLGDMSYSEWKESHVAISHRITKQEEIAEIMKARYIRELYGGYSSGGGTQVPLNSTKLEKTLGNDYADFKSKVEKSETVDLFNKYGDSCNYKREKTGGYWRSADDSLHWSMCNREGRDKYSVLAHESGHMFDARLGKQSGLNFTEIDAVNAIRGSSAYKLVKETPSCSDEFLAAIRKDAKALKPRLDDRSIVSEMLSSQAARNASHGVQDALDGFFGTQSKGLLPWGHGERYYNRCYNKKFKDWGYEKDLKQVYINLGFDASNQTKVKNLARVYETASEAWANVTAAVTCGGLELEAIQKYMPYTLEAYLKIIKGVG